MPELESKLPGVGTTIFTVMSRLAEECGAINLSQGYPDYQPPVELLDRVTYHLHAGNNQYPHMTGIEALRQQISLKISKLYGVQPDAATDVTVTSGATEALFCAIHAVVRPGDEVIVFDPAYDSYDPAITLAGAKTIHLPLLTPGFDIDWDRLADALNDRTRLIIVNSPHNPSGGLLTQSDLQRLAEIVRRYDLYILSDEVYEHIVFDGEQHASVLANDELAPRSFAVFSFGKTYHATGWKVGYCVAPAPLSQEFRRVHQFNTFTTATPLQHALADYLRDCPQHYLGLPAFYQEKRDRFLELFKDSALKFRPSRGTYFQLADYSAVSDLSDAEFAHQLTKEQGVAVIPISAFYEEPPDARYIRFCFAKEMRTLEEAAERLSNL
ncbi:MAG: pyridoxal phosphate-dependent aminotransferase [Candidatus Rariloculaceae bacterium]